MVLFFQLTGSFVTGSLGDLFLELDDLHVQLVVFLGNPLVFSGKWFLLLLNVKIGYYLRIEIQCQL
jgi:hypothetical protein